MHDGHNLTVWLEIRKRGKEREGKEGCWRRGEGKKGEKENIFLYYLVWDKKEKKRREECASLSPFV